MARIMARTAITDGIIGRHDFPSYLLGKSCKSGINVTPSMTFTFTFKEDLSIQLNVNVNSSIAL